MICSASSRLSAHGAGKEKVTASWETWLLDISSLSSRRRWTFYMFLKKKQWWRGGKKEKKLWAEFERVALRQTRPCWRRHRCTRGGTKLFFERLKATASEIRCTAPPSPSEGCDASALSIHFGVIMLLLSGWSAKAYLYFNTTRSWYWRKTCID